MFIKYIILVFCPFLLLARSYTANPGQTLQPSVQPVVDHSKAIPVTADSFQCLKKMHSVRGFFVGNLLGEIDDTIAVAMQTEGGIYPPGSIVQLVPTEAMIKHHKGWSQQTNDWEFFELKVSKAGSKIKVRGTTEVKNKFDGNCYECHIKAEPQWDFICEDDHGCDSLPIPGFLIRWAQKNDPRCDVSQPNF